MVIVDSSALIPLAWVGRLGLLSTIFDEIHITEGVREEVLVEGKRGTAALARFLDTVEVDETPSDASDLAELEGITVTDAAVITLAADRAAALVANDKALIEVAKTQGVSCYWVTTVLLKATKQEVISADEAGEVLYDLVDGGMNLDPSVYARLQRRLEDFEEEAGG